MLSLPAGPSRLTLGRLRLGIEEEKESSLSVIAIPFKP